MAAEQTLDAKLEHSETIASPLLYTRLDVPQSRHISSDVPQSDCTEPNISQAFVHDTYRDFFLARYFADAINYGSMSIPVLYTTYFDCIIKEDISTIRSRANNVIEFLVNLLDRTKAVELICEVSTPYFMRKEDNFDSLLIFGKHYYDSLRLFFEGTVYLSQDELDNLICDFSKGSGKFLHHPIIRALDLSYQLAYNLNLSTSELPRDLLEEISLLVKKDCFWFFGTNVQTYMFKHLPSNEKRKMIDMLIGGSLNGLTYSSISFDKFAFDLDATKYVLSKLASGCKTQLWLEESTKDGEECIQIDTLSEYLVPNKEVIVLLLEYLHTLQPNRLSVAKILINMNLEHMVIEPLFNMLNHAKKEYCYENTRMYKRKVLDLLFEACRHAYSIWEKIIEYPESTEREWMLTNLRKIANNGNKRAKNFLEWVQKKEWQIRANFSRKEWGQKFLENIICYIDYEEGSE